MSTVRIKNVSPNKGAIFTSGDPARLEWFQEATGVPETEAKILEERQLAVILTETVKLTRRRRSTPVADIYG